MLIDEAKKCILKTKLFEKVLWKILIAFSGEKQIIDKSIGYDTPIYNTNNI